VENEEKQRKFYWHANTSSGGTLSLGVTLEGEFSKDEKEEVLAEAIEHLYEHMEENGYIPHNAQLMSSRDISNRFGKTRQYWEKLLNEGKILYKETSAGRITTDLWVQGYLGNKEQVDKYVKDVKTVLKAIDQLEHKDRWWQKVDCPVCGQHSFDFAVNVGGNTNGVCRNMACGFHVHTTN
jgi:hypothetical protein